MGNSHGGRKVKLGFLCNGESVVPYWKNVAYPHSVRSKLVSGCGEWVAWEQTVPHRPAQALELLCLEWKDKRIFTREMGKDLIVFLIKNDLVVPEDLYFLSKEKDDVFGVFFKVLIKGLYGYDMK
jgi:hypothetical protein